jgi:acetoin utilization deacetylase AcuC-like enzyme
MKTVYSDTHHLHHGKVELIDGEMKACFEMPQRADTVLARIRTVGLGEVLVPKDFGRGPIEAIHAPDFVQFLHDAWSRWSALGRTHDALPLCWPVPGLRSDRVPRDIDGQMGFYAMDAGVPIAAGTWTAIYHSAQVALTAAELVSRGSTAAFALCRPPGHHAAARMMGGYCYLNNAAIAAQYLRDQGAAKVLILDVDYHHGNGTQSIFYERGDVSFISLHGDPAVEYPYFLGYADEQGQGEGRGHNHNFPLPLGTAWDGYATALDEACRIAHAYHPDALVVSLGLDTFAEDPISQFRLGSADYLEMGARLGKLGRPTLFCFEGGYAVEALGENTVNVLRGFEDASG